MLVNTAIKLVDLMIYKPEWIFQASDHSDRFQDSIRLHIEYPAQDTARDQAAAGYPRDIKPYCDFPIMVGGLDEVDLYKEIMKCILKIEEHEAREYMRIWPTLWAPFHPHQQDGIRRWSPENMQSDLLFGVA